MRSVLSVLARGLAGMSLTAVVASCSGHRSNLAIPLMIDQEPPASVAWAPAVPRPAPPERVSIEDAVREATANNLGLLAQRYNLSIADAALITARIYPNPVLTLDVDHVDIPRVRRTDLSEAAVRVDVPILLGGKRDSRTELARQDRRIAEHQLADSIRKLRQDTALACIDVLQAKANLALAIGNLKTFESLVQINETRLKAGAVSPVELTRSKVSLLQMRSTVRRAELDLTGAKTRLKAMLGRRALSDPIDVTDELQGPLASDVPGLSELGERAFRARPDLLAARTSQARTQADLNLQIALGVVDLSVGVEYRKNGGDVGDSLVGLFVSAPIPLWNPNAGEIARAQAQVSQAVKQLQAVEADVLSDLRQAHDEFVSSRDLVREIQGELLETARQVRDTERQRYERGASSLLEFLDAERSFIDANQGYNDALAAYRKAAVRLNSAVGEEVLK